MTLSTFGAIHACAALAALALGAFVLFDAKGTFAHRLLGAGYVLAMVVVNFSSFGIMKLLGHFGPFHALAVLSLAAIVGGTIPLIRRRNGWLLRHYRAMAWSYIGLLSATMVEVMVRVPLTRTFMTNRSQVFAVAFGVLIVMTVIGGLTVRRLEGRVTARFAAS